MPATPEPAPDNLALRRALEVRDFLEAMFPGERYVVVVEGPGINAVFTNLPPDELPDLLRAVADGHPTDTVVLVPPAQ
ncbi:MAG: hypothetical protein ABTQ27_09620 [Amaricoccus sp.]|uniref:hypothetical protein n=1 Tax=Amaricoccus sp. TaxID=1872485 RepID=UPI0033150B27